MKPGILIKIVLCVILVSGCEDNSQETAVLNKSLINAELINTYNDIGIQNAVITQHTLFPYHFIENSEKLNELGSRDLSVLANHFRENPGRLNLRRSNTQEELYQARVAFVMEQLKLADVEVDRMTISDGLPGGPGMSSERVLDILEKSEKSTTRRVSTSGTTVSSRSR